MKEINIRTQFGNDVLEGLSSEQKFLSSKYFYNDKGSKIFQDIMRMPEYYLTDCEFEIFKDNKQQILSDFANGQSRFELLELGAGDGLKTKVLLNHFLNQKVDFKYLPIDISKDAVKKLVGELKDELPTLKVDGLIGDYFDLISDIKVNGYLKKIVLFLGSNIGNFSREVSLDFLTHLKRVLDPQDQVFIGFDMKKNSKIILNAYNDPYGHTSAFNLNLLRRINDELGANFKIENFKHQEVYDEQSGTAKSYIYSLKKQIVDISTLNRTFSFYKDEPVFMEMSQKYDLEMIADLANNSGFEIVRNYYDKRQYFVNSLWKLKP
ncbi:MAG: L-histidine N(alpha)-methyltransferase [Bacteroidota bacterium]